MSSDLVIVYHRQPYEEVEIEGKTVFRENTSPNGIVPTLKSFFGHAERGAWVAWKLAEDTSNPEFERRIEIEDSFGTYTVSRLPLTSAQVKSFYHITSKAAFWPILHSFKERYDYVPVDWPTFREVNWAFAEAAAAEASPGAVVWVHDYNLWLVPAYLRQMRPDVTISFFHHTPFPGPDMFNVLPWRKEIIESLLACDVVGFHIPRYAANFAAVAQSLLEADVVERAPVAHDLITDGTALSERKVPTSIRYEGRDVTLLVSPVGVDAAYIESVARSTETEAKVADLRAELGEAQMILSVGRTDYTKGGADQLLCFERLLERRHDLAGKVRLMHVSVSANRNMTVYDEIQTEIEQIVGRINGRFGTFAWQPITLMSRAVPFLDLVAHYRAADIAWVTPLADGMNLVAKEFVACRTDGDGVLVLSEFAGAAVELSSAVLTNPFSTRAMDMAIELALGMPVEERRARMRGLTQVVKTRDSQAWSRDQERSFRAAMRSVDPDRSAA